jgi:hypothetical protein
MIILHDKDGNRTVMTYQEAVAGGYIKQPKVTWSQGMIKEKAVENERK